MDGGYGKAAAVRIRGEEGTAHASYSTVSISQTPLPRRSAEVEHL